MEIVKENGKELLCEGPKPQIGLSKSQIGCGSRLLVQASDLTEEKSFDRDGDFCGNVKGFICPICKAFTEVDMREFSKSTA